MGSVNVLWDKLVTSLEELSYYTSVHRRVMWDEPKHVKSNYAKNYSTELLSYMDGKKLEIYQSNEGLIRELHSMNHLLDPIKQQSIGLLILDLDKVNLLSTAFFKAYSKAAHTCKIKHREAKAAGNYSIVLPYFKELHKLTLEMAAAYRSLKPELKTPYDVLSDDFEPGTSAELLRTIFQPVIEPVSNLVKAFSNHPNQPKEERFKVATDDQMVFCHMMAKLLGFNDDAGLFLENTSKTASNNCSPISRDDVRFTTRCNNNDVTEGLFTTFHETGHALYFQGVDEELSLLFGEGGISHGLHESQSRFYEVIIGKHLSTWKGVYEDWQRITDSYDDVSIEEFWRSLHIIKPSYKRTGADEASYMLHIALRSELGIDMINGNLALEDLPEAYNQKMRDYLGITVQNDTEGCLQDGQWYAGSFTYFPSYGLGTILAAQLWNAMLKDMPYIEDQLEAKNFSEVLGWLRRKIHTDGVSKTIFEAAKDATGEELNANHFIEYVQNRYAIVYHGKY